ncbi:hypothetical protein NKR23_g7630 [Pleurostoma richardsiae]|uniref:Uncharacterized protein n=1 Tax=Pleurostoma richardsiae TaxID=41990 RepID=A0AA38RL33_9PEZI|nr:hypothetical protein NKR23_g7630 [Pleurostoma richardsiae]
MASHHPSTSSPPFATRTPSGAFKPWAAATSASSSTAEAFTPEMRDRQARGKDPYQLSDGSDDDSAHERGTKMRLGGGRLNKEPFARTERRDFAATVLDSPELLMMFAQSSGDSIPATRLRFMRIMCGYDDEDDDDMAVGQRRRQQHQQQQQQGRPDANRRRGGDRAGAAVTRR